MRNINLFVEDEAHEDFLTALIQRFAEEYSVKINIKAYSNAMNLQRIEQIDDSMGRLLRALQRQFRTWQQTEA